jgi:hypothetical protein
MSQFGQADASDHSDQSGVSMEKKDDGAPFPGQKQERPSRFGPISENNRGKVRELTPEEYVGRPNLLILLGYPKSGRGKVNGNIGRYKQWIAKGRKILANPREVGTTEGALPAGDQEKQDPRGA